VPTLKRHLLVVAGRGGVVFYSWDAASLLKVVTLGEEGSSAGGEEGPAGGTGSTLLARGVASIDGQVAVGEWKRAIPTLCKEYIQDDFRDVGNTSLTCTYCVV
jgi:hypothetical protein